MNLDISVWTARVRKNRRGTWTVRYGRMNCLIPINRSRTFTYRHDALLWAHAWRHGALRPASRAA